MRGVQVIQVEMVVMEAAAELLLLEGELVALLTIHKEGPEEEEVMQPSRVAPRS